VVYAFYASINGGGVRLMQGKKISGLRIEQVIGKPRAGDTPVVRPPTLAFSVDERPPFSVLVTMAIQHILVLSSYFVLPVLVVSATGAEQSVAIEYVRMSVIVIGIATILQCLPRGAVGSGYAVPQLSAPIFFGCSVTAASIGGLGLISGMTLFAGVLMVMFSAVFERLRVLLSSEVIGVIVLMVGISLLPNALRGVLEVPQGLAESLRFQVIAVSVISFGIMVAVTVTRTRIRRMGVLFGVAAGTLLSLALGIVPSNAATLLGSASWLLPPFPLAPPALRFEWSLVPAFAVAALASCAKTSGDLTIFQKANDAEWVRPDFAPLRRGILASGLGNCLAGLLGSMGTGTSTACIGLSMATRTMSRAIALVVGTAAIVLGCIPVVPALFLLIPDPVKGAMVLFVVCFLMVSGFQLITSRMLDERRTFIVGISLSLGLGVQFLPDLYHGLLPQALESGLTVAALTALLLNLIGQLFLVESATLKIPLGPDAATKVAKEIELLGSKWGARREVIMPVVGALTELTELLVQRHTPELRLELTFREALIKAKAIFAGPELSLPEIPPEAPILLEKGEGLALLSGYQVRAFCKSIEQNSADGETTLDMRFQH
jgi:xanthine permease XanP